MANRILPGLIWLILWILSWLPGFILRFFSFIIHSVVFSLFRYRSDVVDTNISRSLPELSPMQQNKAAEKFHQHFSELFLEMVMYLRLRPSHRSRRIRFSNPEQLSGALEKKQNIIVMAGHYGNWEWNLLPILASGYRVFAVYKPQSNELAGQLMNRIRQKPGILLVPMKDTLRILTREIRESNSPFALLLVADQTPPRVDIRFRIPFLNQDTAFFTGGEKLARRFGMPVYYTDQQKLGFARYIANITPVYDGSSKTEDGQITREFARLLEASVRHEPHLWLWTHRRWKYQSEELPLHA